MPELSTKAVDNTVDNHFINQELSIHNKNRSFYCRYPHLYSVLIHMFCTVIEHEKMSTYKITSLHGCYVDKIFNSLSINKKLS